MTAPRPTPTIALVAVGGAGDQRPGQAARAVADLLLRLKGGRRGGYAAFVERAVRIPTRPARVNPRSAPNVAPDLARSIFAEQHPFLRTQLQYGGAAARDREEDSPDHQLMRAQLAEYRSTGESYETVRLEGERVPDSGEAGAGEPPARLHVYEMRWSDLTRPAAPARRMLSELYQLFFHLAHLGRTALDHARLEHPTSALWRVYGLTHIWAVRLLTVFVPALCAAVLTTVGAAAVAAVVDAGPVFDRLAVATWLLGVGGLVYLLFDAYERLRPGALATGLGAYVLAATAGAFVAAGAETDEARLAGTLHVLEVEAVVTAGLWSGIYLLGMLAGGLGVAASVRLNGAARDRARRAARTAAVTLAVSATLVLAATYGLWSALARTLDGFLPDGPFTALIPAFHRDGQTYAAFVGRVVEVSAGAGVPLLLLSACAIAAVGAVVIGPTLIAEVRPPGRGGALFEERATTPPTPARDAPVDTDALWAAWERFRREGDRSQRLGERLTGRLRLLGAAALLLYVMAFVVAPGLSVTQWLSGMPAATPLGWPVGTTILATAGSLVAAALGIVLLGGRVAPTLGLRSLLDVVLDVDDYLRTHPRDATPRARIAERYVSLLRYLCRWRDHAGRPYDAIVIVAHSQGATVTTDLLSFIQREEDPELDAIRRPLTNGVPSAVGRRLYLFTTGNPLRQLYSEWFPHLFGWVRGERGEGVARPLPAVPREPWMLLPRLEQGHRVAAPAIPDASAPDPYAMGVTRWVNAYRSGDYVGRALWRPALDGCDALYRCAPPDAATRLVGDAPPVTYVSEDAHRSRRELCIGAGAHTHYWDATAKAIAVELDLLVADATKAASRVAKDAAATAEGG